MGGLERGSNPAQALSCRRTAQWPHGQWVGGETLGPTAVILVTRPEERDGTSSVPSDLGPAVFALIPSGEGGWDDLQPTAQGHGSEGLKSWLERRLTPAWKGETEMFAQLQRQAHGSFLPHEEERHWLGWGASMDLPQPSRACSSPSLEQAL